MIEISLWDKAPFWFIDGDLPESAVETLDTELSYQVPDAEYTDAWKQGEWDGRQRLLRESKNGNLYFPVGLINQVRSVLDSIGLSYEVTGQVYPGVGDVDLGWDTDMELRDYQSNAVDEALKHGSGIVVLPTGGGKTLIGIYLLHALKHRAIILCHRKEIADQWVERIENINGVEPSRYYGGTKETGDVMVGLYQSIYDDDSGEVREELDLDHEIALFDEVHRVGADTFSQVALSVSAIYRFGFSATPEREDNATLRVIGGTGPIIADLSAPQLIEEGYLAKPEWYIEEAPSKGGRYPDWHEEYKAEIVKNERRNQMIAQNAESMEWPCYIHVERIKHGEYLEASIPHAEFVHSDTSDREEKIEAFKDGEIPILISTLLGEGFDLPGMASLIMAGGLKTNVGAIQKVGRALRPETETATIMDFIDKGRWVGKHSEERIRTYQNYYGEYGP